MRVLAEMFDSSWQQCLRKTMQFTIAEVQYQDDIDKVMSILRKQATSQEESGDAPELAALGSAIAGAVRSVLDSWVTVAAVAQVKRWSPAAQGQLCL